MPTVIFIRPLGRIETYYTYHWMAPLIDYAIDQGWNVIDLADEKAIRRNAEAAIIQYNPELIIGAGHGFKYSFLGDDGLNIFDKGNLNLLRGRTVYLLSCWVGGGLGKLIGENGGNFIGWDIPISWVLTEEMPHPYGDIRARAIQDINETIARRLLEGWNIWEVYNEAINLFDKWINYWKYEANDQEVQEIIKLTNYDKDGLVVYRK